MRYFPVVLTALLLVGAGVLHGLRTDRWGAPRDLGPVAARLDETPAKVGDWEGKPVELDDKQLAVAEVSGHLARSYVNRRTGDEITAVVLCGRPGPLSLHSPDVCYTGAGYALQGDCEAFAVPAGDGRPAAEFYKGRFVKPGPPAEAIDVLWSWKADGPWSAPSSARLSFVRAQVLYKLYVIRRVARPDAPSSADEFREFLRTFLPELDRHT